jgi:ABC-2 type transport system permease protein
LTSLVRLTHNELYKMFARARTWVMLIILAMTVVFLGILLKFVIEMDISHVLTFMGVATNLSSLVFIFTIILAGDIVASEFSWGTIKLLLIRPASRGKILFAKYLAVVLFLLLFQLIMLVFSYFTGLILFGVSGPVAPDATVGTLLQSYGLELVEIIMASTMAFMISTVFRSSSLAIGLSIFLMFTSQSIVFVLAGLKYPWVKYLLFANTDLSPYLAGSTPYMLSGMSLGFSVTMLILYWMLFYSVSWLLFTRRDVAGI